MKTYTSEIINRSFRKRGIEKTERIVYGKDRHKSHRAIALSLFIDSRMFADEIREELLKED